MTDPFDEELVILYCAPHGQLVATVVQSRDGLELKSIVTVERVDFSSAAEKASVTGGHRAACDAVSTVSQLVAEDLYLEAKGCRRCGPIAVNAGILLPLIRQAIHTKKRTKLVLSVQRS